MKKTLFTLLTLSIFLHADYWDCKVYIDKRDFFFGNWVYKASVTREIKADRRSTAEFRAGLSGVVTIYSILGNETTKVCGVNDSSCERKYKFSVVDKCVRQ